MSGVKRTTKRPNTVVLTGGTFNRIHPGHIYLLAKARMLGKLVVVLANDVHNKKENAIPSRERKKALEALKIADKVIIGDADRFVGVVEKTKPSVIVLGYDQKLPDAETRAYVKKKKIKVVRMDRFGTY